MRPHSSTRGRPSRRPAPDRARRPASPAPSLPSPLESRDAGRRGDLAAAGDDDRAPSRPSARAIASPMPVPPPVTIAVCPVEARGDANITASVPRDGKIPRMAKLQDVALGVAACAVLDAGRVVLDQRGIVGRRGGRRRPTHRARAGRTGTTRPVVRRRARSAAAPRASRRRCVRAEVIQAAYHVRRAASGSHEVRAVLLRLRARRPQGQSRLLRERRATRPARSRPWEPHGIVCEVCIDVATEALQMHNSGASVAAIRDAIEKKYAGTPAAPHADADAAEEGNARLARAALRSAGLADDAFARLFDALQEGVYIGLLGRDATATLAANPHLRADVRLGAGRARRRDSPVRRRSLRRRAGAHRVPAAAQPATARCSAYLLRLRRVDGSASGSRSPRAPIACRRPRRCRVEARDARRHRAQEAPGPVPRPLPAAVCRPRSWRRWARRCPASRTS